MCFTKIITHCSGDENIVHRPNREASVENFLNGNYKNGDRGDARRTANLEFTILEDAFKCVQLNADNEVRSHEMYPASLMSHTFGSRKLCGADDESYSNKGYSKDSQKLKTRIIQSYQVPLHFIKPTTHMYTATCKLPRKHL